MDKQPMKPTTGAPPRAYGLDNLRTCLTGLVIYHHAAIPYGGAGSWIYKSAHHLPNTSIPLMAFNAINQTYFMGSFFYLSGYFSSQALKRKSRKEFLSTKFLKLGIPAVAYTILAGPIGTIFLRLQQGQKLSSLRWDVCTNYWKIVRGLKGPAWYMGLLLVFDTLYAYSPSLKPLADKFNTLLAIDLDILACCLLRFAHPTIPALFTPLNVQTGYAPQYVAAYALGASLAEPTPPMTPTTRNVLAATSIISAAAGLSLLYFYPDLYTIDSAKGRIFDSVKGGPNLLTFCYAAWNESTGYLLGTAILGLFKKNKWLNRKWGDVAKYSYAAFIVHPIVFVGLGVWSDGWKIGGISKTAVIGTATTAMSWAIGWSMVKVVPGSKAVLL